MPTTSTNKMSLRALLLVALGCLFVQTAEAQFIRFTINLPPSFELADRGVPPQILEPVEGSRNVGEMAGLRWMEIRTTENISIIVDINYNNKSSSSLTTSYFLNDGTTNFADAQVLPKGPSAWPMHNGNKTIKELPGELKYLSAWLGMPAKQGGILTITYP